MGAERLGEMATHLEACEDCVEVLAAFDARGSTADVVEAGGDTSPHTKELSLVIEAAREMNRDNDGLDGILEPPAGDGEIGRLGDYRVRARVARGGMGVVLRAEDPALGRDVALKVLAPELAAQSLARERFLREARAAASLDHPNVLPIFAVHDPGGPPYLAMAFEPGGTLADRIAREGALPFLEVLRIARELISGLGEAHASGIVHRDVKPANILLGETAVRLADFGLARAADLPDLTRTGFITGTPAYMSPEQLDGEPGDARSDLFSLGAVLYAMAAGREPFHASGTFALIKKVAVDPHTPLKNVASVPAWFSQLVDGLLEKDPEQRIGSTTEVIKALDEAGENVRTTRPSPWGWIAAAGIAASVAVGWWMLRAADDDTRLVSGYAGIGAAFKSIDQGKPGETVASLTRLLRDEPQNSAAAEALVNTLVWGGVTEQSAAAKPVEITYPAPVAEGIGFFGDDKDNVFSVTQEQHLSLYDPVTGGAVFGPFQVPFGGEVVDFADNTALAVFRTRGEEGEKLWFGESEPFGVRPVQIDLAQGSSAVAIDPLGKEVLVGWRDGAIRGYLVADGKEMYDVQVLGGAVLKIVRSGLKENVFAGGKNFQCVVSLASGETLATRSVDTLSAILSPDKNHVAAASSDGRVVLWDLAAAKVVAEIQHSASSDGSLITCVFSSDNRRLFTAGAGSTMVRTWDTSTWTEAERPLDHPSPVTTIELDDGDQRLAAGLSDGTLQIWSLEAGAWIAPPLALQDAVEFAGFGHHSPMIVAVDIAGKAKVYRLAQPDLPEPPEWFLGVAETVVGLRANARGFPQNYPKNFAPRGETSRLVSLNRYTII